jgi:hypothetical protein
VSFDWDKITRSQGFAAETLGEDGSQVVEQSGGNCHAASDTHGPVAVDVNFSDVPGVDVDDWDAHAAVTICNPIGYVEDDKIEFGWALKVKGPVNFGGDLFIGPNPGIDPGPDGDPGDPGPPGNDGGIIWVWDSTTETYYDLSARKADILQIYLNADFLLTATTETTMTGLSERHDNDSLGELTSDEIIPDKVGWIKFDMTIVGELSSISTSTWGHAYVWLEKYDGVSAWSFVNDSMIELHFDSTAGTNFLSMHKTGSRSFCDECTDISHKYRVRCFAVPNLAGTFYINFKTQDQTTTTPTALHDRTGGCSITMTRPYHPALS